MENKEKFYKTKWFTIVMLIFIAPVGIILLWVNKHWNNKTRMILTVVSVLFFTFVAVTGQTTEDEKAVEEAKQEQVKTDDEKEQKVADEQEKVEKEKKEKEAEKDKEEKEKQKKSDEEKKKKEKVSKEDEITKLMDKISISELISVRGVSEDEPLTFQVELLGTDNLTQKMTRQGMLMAVLEAVYAVKETGYEINNMGISVKFPLVDQYGNEEDEYVIKSDFSGETINKLSDDKFNINVDNLNTIADEWWEYPIMQD